MSSAALTLDNEPVHEKTSSQTYTSLVISRNRLRRAPAKKYIYNSRPMEIELRRQLRAETVLRIQHRLSHSRNGPEVHPGRSGPKPIHAGAVIRQTRRVHRIRVHRVGDGDGRRLRSGEQPVALHADRASAHLLELRGELRDAGLLLEALAVLPRQAAGSDGQRAGGQRHVLVGEDALVGGQARDERLVDVGGARLRHVRRRMGVAACDRVRGLSSPITRPGVGEVVLAGRVAFSVRAFLKVALEDVGARESDPAQPALVRTETLVCELVSLRKRGVTKKTYAS